MYSKLQGEWPDKAGGGGGVGNYGVRGIVQANQTMTGSEITQQKVLDALKGRGGGKSCCVPNERGMVGRVCVE